MEIWSRDTITWNSRNIFFQLFQGFLFNLDISDNFCEVKSERKPHIDRKLLPGGDCCCESRVPAQSLSSQQLNY